MSRAFNYDEAFSRTTGWLTKNEQQKLKNTRIAIAGLGGVGGSHLLTLTRLGIGKFTVSDLDIFEIANFNRQAGAFLSQVGEQKTTTLVKMALDINPNLDIRVFDKGVTPNNVEEFFEDVDLYVDGLDFFVLNIRRLIFELCAANKIPAITAAPLGMGAAVINFLPSKMTFEQYFRLEGRDEQRQYVRFLVGLAPAMLQRHYLVDPSMVDFVGKKGPSTPMACDICAGMAAVQAAKILLHRGKTYAAPWGQQFDPYLNKYTKTWRPGGNNNPLQQLAIRIAESILFDKKG